MIRGLRLDVPEEVAAEAPSGDGYAIVANDPDASLIIQRILSDDDSVVMPPPESNLSVAPHEKGAASKMDTRRRKVR